MKYRMRNTWCGKTSDDLKSIEEASRKCVEWELMRSNSARFYGKKEILEPDSEAIISLYETQQDDSL